MEDSQPDGSVGRLQSLVHGFQSNSPHAQLEVLRQIEADLDSSTSGDEKEKVAVALLAHILPSYPRYFQSKVRKALQNVLRAYLQYRDSSRKIELVISNFISIESQKSVVAPSNALILVEWAAVVQEELARHTEFSEQTFLSVCSAAAVSLDRCLATGVKVGIRKAAVVATQRGLRKIFHHELFGKQALDAAIKHLTGSAATFPATHAAYIGTIATISTSSQEWKLQLEHHTDNILDFYVKAILGSKSPLPTQEINGLNSFLTQYVKRAHMVSHVVPVIEKAILRSPESVLQGPIIALAQSLPLDVDISDLVLAKLIKPFASAMSSTNSDIREGSAKSLSALLARKQDAIVLVKIATELLTNIKTNKSQDSRALLADCLTATMATGRVSVVIVDGIVPIAAKEANENSLRRETYALGKHLPLVLSSTALEKSVAESILKGCGDKRPGFRRAWLLGVGSTLRQLSEPPSDAASANFVSSALDLVQGVYTELSSSPLPAVQAGTIAAAYILPSLLSTSILDSSLYIPKTECRVSNLESSLLDDHSYLLNARVYTRLTGEEDQRWALRALIGVSRGLKHTTIEGRIGWARAILHLLLSADSNPMIRKETGFELAIHYLRDPASIGKSVVLGLLHLLRESRLLLKPSKPDGDIQNIALERAVSCISPPKRVWEQHNLQIPNTVLEDQAVSTMVILSPELIPRSNWIDNCLLIGVDPGDLTRKKHAAMMTEIISYFQPGEMSPLSLFEKAACRAAADLAFVAPGIAAPLVVKQFTEDLQSDQLIGIGEVEAMIGRAPDEVLIADPLAKINGVIEDKNRKDHAVLKWEEEVRSQLAKKKGAPQKKLTPDQQAKVDAQIAHEKSVRRRVWEVSARLRRGASLIQALAEGPPTDARLWISPAVESMGGALQAGAHYLTDGELFAAYLSCSNRVTDRIGTLRPFIAISTLRSIAPAAVPTEMQTELLEDLGTRVLYRLRFAAEQRPLDTSSLAYALPLIFSVIDHGAIGRPASTDDADAQVLLALEFLSFQMSACSDQLLPREDIIRRLITSIQKYPQHYRLLKDALLEICAAIVDNISTAERDVLLRGVTLPESAARSAALQAIQSELDMSDMKPSVHVWVACQDEDDENAETALAIWEESEFHVTNDLINALPEFLNDRARSTRSSAAKALAHALAMQPQQIEAMRICLQTTYQKEAQPLVPKRDKFGIVQKGELLDRWERRSGLALAFKEMVSVLQHQDVIPLMEFMLSDGPLCDRHATVRSEMVAAGTVLVTLQGKENLESLMKLFERTLQGPDKATQESDWVNEAVIVLYGSLAQHLPAGDSRLKDVITKLVETLDTPSETVQFAVAGCLPPLVRAARADADPYVSSLMEQLFQAKNYAARRGAAYGLAGIVKGKGLGALRTFRIMSSLHAATENKKSPEHREGALFAYELFSLILGRTFEPYVVEVLPQLLACFGDPVASVRNSCLDTAKTCFASLSSYGVRQVLPRLLEGLDETQWRSKKGACDLLGAMAYLDPQQLASSLPDIIPPLTAVLTDSHKEVRAAANNSLKRFGEVISNPEVKSLVDILLKALSDPTKYTEEALDSLIKVSFIHYLDAPSLALVVRILERGLHDRSSTKRKAAQIIGNLAHLTEKRDIITHLPILVTGLRLTSVDPVPATRATASKALGSLVEKLGEDAFPDLIPSLMASLRTDTGAGDRLGSAQALSEVLAGLGTGRLEETLPTILQNVQSARASVREGFMTLFIFLPACFGNSFANYLGQIIPSILSGLADDLEAIRDTALRAGRLLVKNFATRAIDLLLPELQRGLADDSYRIRLSSVELVGDLLFSLTGISAKIEADEEDEGAAQAGQSLLEVLGEERRNKVLSSIYICRCDTSGLVRAASINVWKALVASPRTLRELVPTLTQMIIERLGSSNMEHKVIASNALGEVIRKAGDNIFASLLPSLENGLQAATDSDNRQGICIALREVVNAASPEALEDHEKKLIAIVRLALVDSNTDVREAAAESFDALQSVFGKRAVDQVLPYLLNLLRSDEDADHALSALLTLLTEQTRANVILPNLIPTLLTNPITTFNARALASLAKVGGSSMNRRLPVVLNTLAENIISCRDDERKIELDTAFNTVLCSVDEFDGLNSAISVMLAMMKHDDHRKRAIGAHHLGLFFAATEVDYSRYNQDLIRLLLISFDDRDNTVVKAAWSALSQLTSHLRKEEMESLTISTSQVLKQVGTPGHNLPGFSLPKGIQPVLQIFLQGLMNGTADQKLHAAGGITDIIDRTSPDSLKAFVTQITGPLIRVVGERSVDVKCAIVFALNQLLEKIPTFLRPFLPQLQRSFTKCIADPSSEILRARATKALSTLITLTPRIDPLIAELVTGAKTPDTAIKNAMIKALQEVVSKVGANMSETSREAILGLIDAQGTNDSTMMVTMARLLGAMVKVLPPPTATTLLKSRVLVQPSTPASILALNAVLAESSRALIPDYVEELRAVLVDGIDGPTFIQHNAVLAAGKLLLTEEAIDNQDVNRSIFNALAPHIKPGNDIDTRRLALVVVRTVARQHNAALRPQLPLLVEPVFQCLRDSVIPVKLAAEAAWLQMFDVVESESEVFDKFVEDEKAKGTRPGPVLRMWQDYFKRIAIRLAAQRKEQREAEGGQGGLGLASDEQEDERELWSVGRVDLGEGVFE